MKQALQLKLTQHLALTPQLQQSIRLLQLSTVELNQELERFLMENPLLEREESDTANGEQSAIPVQHPGATPEPVAPSAGDDDPVPEIAGEDEQGIEDWTPESPSRNRTEDDGDSDPQQSAAITPTLREHLLSQVNLLNVPERDRQLIVFLIESLDEDGYLTQSLDELFNLLPADLGFEPEELSIALKHLQHLDPPGIGATNPAQCLELQLLALPESTPHRKLALDVVKEHIGLLAARDFSRLRRACGCTEETLRGAQHLIQSLNPHPGAAFSLSETRYVVPDVIVRKVKSVWKASLNQAAVPRLRVNRMYADILQNQRGGSLSQQLQEARWLVKNIQQRFDTILRVSQAIIDRQRHFFEHGEVAMRPLVLREIAETLGLHESTISRVTTQKYMMTPRGIFELKYFFGSHVATETGGACSATAIRALIKQMVAAEDARKPLSDSRIADILGQQGIVVARRTIAKYRESMHILPVSQRKTL